MQCLDHDTYKGCGVGWLHLTAFETLQKDDIGSGWTTANSRHSFKAREPMTALKKTFNS